MLLDAPESLATELATRYDALQKAEANYGARPTTLNRTVRNAAITALNKTIDKCSIELGQPASPRPDVVVQEDDSLKLLYAAE